MNDGLHNLLFFDPFGFHNGPDIEREEFRRLPECLNYDELINAQNGVYRTKTLLLNFFLHTKFEFGLIDFFKMYSQLIFGKQFVLPISTNTIFHVWEYSDSQQLAKELEYYNSLLIPSKFGAMPNLHDTSIFNFTLIHANFDLLDDFKKNWSGVFVSTSKFDFYVKGSAQGDLTVIYQNSKGLPSE